MLLLSTHARPPEPPSLFRPVPAAFVRNLIYVNARDASGSSHRLLVDSGSPTSFLRVRSRRAKGAVSLVLGERRDGFRLTAATVFDDSEPDGRPEGLLGLDFLQRHQIALDYETGRLWIRKSGPRDTPSAITSFLRRRASGTGAARTIPLRRIPGGYYGVDVTMNEFRCESVLDTGSSGMALITDRPEGWRLDPVADKQVIVHSGPAVAKEYFARTIRVGDFTFHAQPVTCVRPSSILAEPWNVDSVVSPSILPSKLTIIDFPNRRLLFIPTPPAEDAALLRHLLEIPVRRNGSQFRLQGYFVNLPPVIAFQELSPRASEAPGIDTMDRNGKIKRIAAQRDAELVKVSGRPLATLFRSYREAQSGSHPAYAALLALYRRQRRAPETTLLIHGRLALYRGAPLTVSPAP